MIFDTGPIEVFSRNYRIFKKVMRLFKDVYGDLLTTSENEREAKKKTPTSLSKIIPFWIAIDNPSRIAKRAIRQGVVKAKMGSLDSGELEAIALTLEKSRKIKPTEIVMVCDDEKARPILDKVASQYRCGKIYFTLEVLGYLEAYCSLQRREAVKLAKYFQELYKPPTFGRLIAELESLPKSL